MAEDYLAPAVAKWAKWLQEVLESIYEDKIQKTHQVLNKPSQFQTTLERIASW